MLTTEQILIRLGVDSRAVTTGLQKVSALVKGWASGLMHHLQGAIGGFFAVAAIERTLHKIGERIFEITRMARHTGLSTNFLQGLEFRLAQTGEHLAMMERPLMMLSAQAAKQGMSTYQYLLKISEGYEKLNTQEERNLYLQQLGIRNWRVLNELFEGGAKGLEELQSYSVFKLTPENITFGQQLGGAAKMLALGSLNAVANVLLQITRGWSYIFATVMSLPKLLPFPGTTSGFGAFMDELTARTGLGPQDSAKKVMEAIADQEGVSVLEAQRKIMEQQNQLLEQKLQLTEQLNDRDKSSLESMASEARRLTGQKEQPHRMTARLREALKIDTLHKRATLAFEAGNDALFEQLRAQADAMAQAAGWMKFADREPTRAVEKQLKEANKKLEYLEPVAKMAEMVLKDAGQGEDSESSGATAGVD